MKADEPLDYALFQLDSTRTRCELWISAGGVTEKLASGLLKPFLDHLRAAQEQISSGAQSIRLQAPSVTANGRNSGAAWFSKGTMERFVRFVSIPEVLERVSAVEAECQRLDEAINILANESGDGYHLFDMTSGPLPADVKAVDGKAASKAGESRKLKQDYHDTKETTGDTSKRQLLRAMDGRRAMLQKEQKKALAQAVAAGFNMEYMSSLVVFADCFGALQLREACTKFMALRKKIQEFGSLVDEMELAAETVITGLKMNRSGIILVDSDNSGASMLATDLANKRFENQRDDEGHTDDTHEKSVISSSDNQDSIKIGDSRVALIKQRMAASKVGSSILHKKDLPSDHETKYSVENDTGNSEGRTPSPEKRSLSPPRKVQIGRPPVRRQGVVIMKSFVHGSSKSPGTVDTKHKDGDNSESSESDEESGSKVDNNEEKGHKIEHKRLSVQDAISLFESKKRESAEVTVNKGRGVDSQKEASETGNRSVPVKDVLKRWNVTTDSGPALPTTSLKVKDLKQSTERDLSSKCIKPTNSNNEGAGNKLHPSDSNKTGDVIQGSEVLAVHDADKSHAPENERKEKVHPFKASFNKMQRVHSGDLERGEILHSVKATANHNELPPEREVEQKPFPIRLTTATQFDSTVPSPPFLQNSKQQVVPAILGPSEYTKPNIRRWSLTASPFQSTVDEQVMLDCHSNIAGKQSMESPGGQVFRQVGVKGVALSEKVIHSEQKTPQHCSSGKLGLSAYTLLDQHASAVENVCQNKDQELDPKGSNLLKRPNQHDTRDTLKCTGYQIDQSPIGSALHHPTERSASKGTVRRSWSTPSDFHLEALAKMVDGNDNEDEDQESIGGGGTPKDLSGMFYEQYRQKRDAKLRQESNLKRAEREAQMKAMQEALEQSKEELTARSHRSGEHGNISVESSDHILKIRSSSKAGALKNSRENAAVRISPDSQLIATRTSKSASLRQNSSRKVSPSTQKSLSSSTTAHSSIRSTSSPTQKAFPRKSNSCGAGSSQRRGSSGSPVRMADNMLKSSALSHAELRKEPPQPSLGCQVDTLQQEMRPIVQGFPYKDAGHALNLLGMALPDLPVHVSDSRRQSQKSIFMLDELQQGEKFRPSGLSAEDRQDEPDYESVKTFYKENAEFRADSEPDKLSMKATIIKDAVKTSYEEDFSSSSSNVAPFESEEPESVSVGEYEEASYLAEQSSATEPAVHALDIASEDASHSYLAGQNLFPFAQNGSQDPQQEAFSAGEMSEKFLASLDGQAPSLQVGASSFEEPPKPPLPTLFSLHAKERFENSRIDSHEVGVSRSFSSPPKSLQIANLLNGSEIDCSVSNFQASPLALKFSGDGTHPIDNPVKFDQPQSRKTWIDPQKNLSLSSQHLQKETSKGFKRLLKFGRKNRGSEPSTHDWIAASTSEGDDDGDESKDCFGEDDLRASSGDARNAYKLVERVLKSNDLDGVSVAGPRSFFSLSSFRSKSSESRSRA